MSILRQYFKDKIFNTRLSLAEIFVNIFFGTIALCMAAVLLGVNIGLIVCCYQIIVDEEYPALIFFLPATIFMVSGTLVGLLTPKQDYQFKKY